MLQISHILCPVDFSEFSRKALDHAAALARWSGARLTALYVYNEGLPPGAIASGIASEPLTLTPQHRSTLMTALERFATGDDRGIRVECRLAEGEIATSILDLVRAEAADLLVLGTHGRSGFERLVLGSVTEKILRRATCPVLTVPPSMSAHDPTAPKMFARILVAVDFPEPSMRGLEYALSLAQEADADLTVVHVVETPWRYGEEWADGTNEHVALVQGMASVKERLTRAVPDDARDWCRVSERVEVGRPYRELLRIASETHAGLIVLGAHGHGVIDRMFFGSTAQHVVRQAACPVLTVRHAARTSDTADGTSH